jgi:hypothetical protein
VKATSYLHFHPSWSVALTDGRIIAERAAQRVEITMRGIRETRCISGRTHPPQGWFAAAFGQTVPNAVAEMVVADPDSFGFTITKATSSRS